MADQVILLHGLWMRRPAMWPLARRLRAAGFAVRCFPYATLWARPEASLRRLADWVRAAAPGPVHLVGHSLGGVTALALFEQARDLPAGRVVCIGSPIAGSRAAARLRERGLRVLAGRSVDLLGRGAELPEDRQVGMIAGTRALGLGRLVSSIDGDNDGTVAVAETRRPGLADHLCLPVSHSGLLLDSEVARQCVIFLRLGHFEARC
jgi:pimeloyl-ACP methyl ester carboxylesterase